MKLNYSFIRNFLSKYFCLPFSLENFKNIWNNPTIYLRSYYSNLTLQSIGCLMCVCDEDLSLNHAINSSLNYVNKYYIIDKNGRMKPIIEYFKKNFKINIHYEVKKDLNLLESRKYGISLINEKWILIQDGDELLLNGERLKDLTKKYYVCYQSKKLCDEGYIQPYHNILFYNEKKLIYFGDRKDVPKYKGRYKRLNFILLNNKTRMKTEEKLRTRNHWKEYQYSGYKGSLLEYIKEKYGEWK